MTECVEAMAVWQLSVLEPKKDQARPRGVLFWGSGGVSTAHGEQCHSIPVAGGLPGLFSGEQHAARAPQAGHGDAAAGAADQRGASKSLEEPRRASKELARELREAYSKQVSLKRS